jgi:hypothetical protein
VGGSGTGFNVIWMSSNPMLNFVDLVTGEVAIWNDAVELNCSVSVSP